MVDLAELAKHVIDGHAEEVARLTQQALQDKIAPAEILEKSMIAGMTEVGVRFRENIFFIPEVLHAAQAMKAGMRHLEPVLSACGIPPLGKFLIGTVKGDIHDIGKNLVTTMLQGAGFRVIDVGVNVPVEKFLAAIEEHQPEIVGMSALLTTTMVQMKSNMDAFREKGLLTRLRVMVGGAPVTEDYARSIGAHGYARDAMTAATRARELLQELKAR